MSFFYRLVDSTNLKAFYLEYEEYWKGFLARLSVTKIKNVSTEYVTLDYFNKRKEISDRMKSELAAIFEEKTNGIFTVTDF